MSTINPAHAVKGPDGEPIPPLEDGQRLTRDEFERRYQAMPNLKKAELIDGVVSMPSPVHHRQHSRPHFHLVTWLGVYEIATPGIEGGDNGTMRLDLGSEPQPDAYLLIAPSCGGQARITTDDYVEDGPELVAEVAASNRDHDLGDKLHLYRRHDVREYLVWSVPDLRFDWFVRVGDRFELMPPGPDGVLRSTVFPGLWLDPAALVTGDMPRVLAVVQQGVASREHADFVARLAEEEARRRG